MKTPEEIMEAFKCCERDVLDPCSGCPYEREYAEDWKCALNNDALACIQQLKADLERANNIIMQVKAMLDDDGK